MAATRLIPMHANKGRTIAQCLKNRTDYVEDEAKTEAGKYISSYACQPQTVDKEFLYSKAEYLRITGRQQKNDVIAYQLRQSFKPGEINPEEANQIGYETAMSLTKGHHAFIVATHTDKAHIHNHIIFNSTNLDCDGKFRNFFLSSFVIQRISDGLCLEHGLSVIKPRQYDKRDNRGYNRKSIRSVIEADIDKILKARPDSLGDFIKKLQQAGYEVKEGKHLAIKGKNQKRFIRLDSLKEGYSQKDLEKIWRKEQPVIETKSKPRDFDLLINIQEKLAQGKSLGYANWAKKYNVKQVAKSLLFLQERGIRDYETLSQKAASSAEKYKQLTQTIKSVEKRLDEISTLRGHIINYSKTRDTYVDYRKSGYSPKFYEAHRQELTIHKAAKDAFSKLDGKVPTMTYLNTLFQEQLDIKRAAYQEYGQAKQEHKDYMIAKQNIDSILKADFAKDEKRRERTRSQSR